MLLYVPHATEEHMVVAQDYSLRLELGAGERVTDETQRRGHIEQATTRTTKYSLRIGPATAWDRRWERSRFILVGDDPVRLKF